MRRVAALAWTALLLPLASSGQPLSPVEEVGRRLYHDGVNGAGTPITARVAGSSTPLRGQAMACGNCHGEDGRGRAESGVEPGDVTWSELTKPYGHAHANGRRHGPYDARSFRRAMRDGLDPAGNRLEPAMPLYALGDGDLDALLAYLNRLEGQLDPGLSANAIRIGTLLPASGRLADSGAAVRSVLEGYFEIVNQRGGVHGRRLQLVVEPIGDDLSTTGAAAGTLVRKRNVFALLAPMTARVERELLEAADAAQMPVIGPLTLFPESATDPSQTVFHLLSGVPELAEVLGTRMHSQLALSGRPVVLLHEDTSEGRATAVAVEARLRARGYSALQLQPLLPPDQLAARLKEQRANAVLVLSGPASLTATARALARDGATPFWLLPAPSLPPDIFDWPATLDGRVVLAYPSLPNDRSPSGMTLLQQAARGEVARNPALQVSALASAVVLVEGLSRAGRELSRRKLIVALEGMRNFETGLTPPIRYSAGRRVGVYGGYVVNVDLQNRTFRPSPDFVRLQ
jgi:ABC-type branched-subunit amino acid transport system substrate-binding protein